MTDIYDHLQGAVEQLRNNGSKDFTIDGLKSAFPEISAYKNREIIEALETLSRKLRIKNAAVGGQLWDIK